MWFKKALTLAPNDPSVRDQFGKLFLLRETLGTTLKFSVSVMLNINQ